jgi:hypothetical protein
MGYWLTQLNDKLCWLIHGPYELMTHNTYTWAEIASHHRKVKNLGLMMNDELTWEDQVSKVCRKVLFTLKRLWIMSNFTPMEMRHKSVTSLILSQFLYCDVIFSKSTARVRERLKVAFNSCARYIYGISRYEHITQYDNRILGIPLNVLHHEQYN